MTRKISTSRFSYPTAISPRSHITCSHTYTLSCFPSLFLFTIVLVYLRFRVLQSPFYFLDTQQTIRRSRSYAFFLSVSLLLLFSLWIRSIEGAVRRTITASFYFLSASFLMECCGTNRGIDKNE